MNIRIRICRSLGTIAILLVLGLGSSPVTASSLNFVPSNPTVLAGNPVTIDVFLSDPAGTLVGAFNFFVNYDPDVLTFDSGNLLFGPSLGGPVNSFQDVFESQAGKINVAELSIVSDLTSLQDGTSDLLLFSVTFDTGPIGESPLTFSGGIDPDFEYLGDDSGLPITLDTIGTGSINVVPIPGSAWLMGLGLASLIGFRQMRQRKTST